MCSTTSTYFKEPGIDATMPVCAFCEIKMRDALDVARDCVRKEIVARRKDGRYGGTDDRTSP